MCTVVIRVGEDPTEPIRMLAVRDEDPARTWRPLGPWWPEEYPGVDGVRDDRAGGAWLAADPAQGRVAVLLNRLDFSDLPESELTTRGAIALEAVAGRGPVSHPRTHGFNLVDVAPDGARVVSWDGLELRETPVPPGTHMIAHDDLDDPETPRVVRWLDHFAAEPTEGERWWEEWMRVLAQTDEGADRGAPEAIIRDAAFEGFRSTSLLLAAASVSAAGADVRYVALDEPGRLGSARFA